MLKKFLTTVTLFLMMPAFAGQFDDAIKHNDKVFLYIHSNNCRYCLMFNPNYDKLTNSYGKSMKFLKINAYTREGAELLNSIGANYLPYVMMIDNKRHVIKDVAPNCLLDYACVNKATNNFINK